MTASPKKWFCNTDTNFPTGCNGASYSLDKTTLSDCASVAPDAVGETKCILTPPLCDFATFVCTSANVSNNLFADKNTSHAIAIKSGADTCYINLEPGQSSDAINIRMDDTISFKETQSERLLKIIAHVDTFKKIVYNYCRPSL